MVNYANSIKMTHVSTNSIDSGIGFRRLFGDDGIARTLLSSYVTKDLDAGIDPDLIYVRSHKSGWIISGRIIEDYLYSEEVSKTMPVIIGWVNEFKAVHPVYGKVWGNFENLVEADNGFGYDHFLFHHPYMEWDYNEM